MTRSLTLVALALAMTIATRAHAQTYSMAWYSIDAGGEVFTFGGAYELSGAVGQHDAGTLTGGNYALAGGFWSAHPEPPCPADFNGDGMANGIDVGLFLQAYSTQNPAADMNDDGFINGIDVGLFLQAYSTGC